MKRILENHLIMSGVYKGISGVSLFITIRLLMDYLGQENYGLWVLVFTLFQLVLLMDFGIQSSLKTKIPVLIAENNFEMIKSYIKTNYFLTIILAIIIFLFFTVFIFLIDLNAFLNIDFQTSKFVKSLFILNIFFFCLGLIANLQKSLYVAFLEGKYAEESIAVNQIGLTFFVWLCVFFLPNLDSKDKLIAITIINGVFTLAINLFYTYRFFIKENINLKSSINLKGNYLKDILKLGGKFLITQIGVMFIFSSDQYVISNAFGPSEVAIYEVVTKYFQFPVLVFMAVLNPLWSVFAMNYIDKNKKALSDSFKKFNKYYIAIIIVHIIAMLLCPFVLTFWIKETINVPAYFILLTALVATLRIFTVFYTYFLYGVGHLNLYILILLLSVIIKVPLSYFFINLGFGINGVVLSSLIILIFWTIIFPLKSYKIISKIKVNEI